MSHSCRSCSTRVSFVSLEQRSCRAYVAFVLLVLHSCCIRVARVVLVPLVAGTRVVNLNRSAFQHGFTFKKESHE